MTKYPIRIGIFGASNSGKSALINFLAKKEVVESTQSFTRYVTKEINEQEMPYKEYQITIFDTPAIELAHTTEKFSSLLEDGLHVFIICIKTSRISKAVQKELRKILEIFHFVQSDPVILVFTHFEASYKLEDFLCYSPKEIQRLYSMFKENTFCIDNIYNEKVREATSNRSQAKKHNLDVETRHTFDEEKEQSLVAENDHTLDENRGHSFVEEWRAYIPFDNEKDQRLIAKRKHTLDAGKGNISNAKREHTLHAKREHSMYEKREHTLDSKKEHFLDEEREHSSKAERQHISYAKGDYNSDAKREHNLNEEREHPLDKEIEHTMDEGIKHTFGQERQHALDPKRERPLDKDRENVTRDDERVHNLDEERELTLDEEKELLRENILDRAILIARHKKIRHVTIRTNIRVIVLALIFVVCFAYYCFMSLILPNL